MDSESDDMPIENDTGESNDENNNKPQQLSFSCQSVDQLSIVSGLH